ncbi:hypothetical protein [Kistimonas asteriae]|uniref:hypothetical protein n=1 Tax=Kistimonas asteriae TaxID=517724 RepID=UPI001BA95E49|nr:hypothetical protein [Kistimonas asteriae]
MPGLGKNNAHKGGAPSLPKKKKNKKKKTITQLKESLVSGLVAQNDIPTLEFERPNFKSMKEYAARLEAVLATGDESYLTAKLDIKHEDLAAPHRAPYSKLRDLVLFGTKAEVENVVDLLTSASIRCENAFRNVTSDDRYTELADLYQATRIEVEQALSDYKTPTLNVLDKYSSKLDLIKALNNLASNAPGLGPHSGTNAPVSDRLHLHLTDLPNEPVTPRGNAANKGFSYEPVATVTDSSGDRKVVSVTGAHHSLQPGQHVPHYKDVSVKPGILRGALFVDHMGTVYKPKNPTQAPTGDFNSDWEAA